MATIAVYDETALPCLSYPFDNTEEHTKKYLGGEAMTGGAYATISITQMTDLEMQAVHEFRRVDCNSGLDPFLLPIPYFGLDVNVDLPAVLVQFKSEFKSSRQKGYWSTSFKVEILGNIVYTIDDLGNYVVTDAGDFVVSDGGDFVSTGNNINSYKEVLWS